MRDLLDVWHAQPLVWRFAIAGVLTVVAALGGVLAVDLGNLFKGEPRNDAADATALSPTRTRLDADVRRPADVPALRDVSRRDAGMGSQRGAADGHRWPAPAAKGFIRDRAIGRDQAHTDRRARLITMQREGAAFWR